MAKKAAANQAIVNSPATISLTPLHCAAIKMVEAVLRSIFQTGVIEWEEVGQIKPGSPETVKLVRNQDPRLECSVGFTSGWLKVPAYHALFIFDAECFLFQASDRHHWRPIAIKINARENGGDKKIVGTYGFPASRFDLVSQQSDLTEIGSKTS